MVGIPIRMLACQGVCQGVSHDGLHEVLGSYPTRILTLVTYIMSTLLYHIGRWFMCLEVANYTVAVPLHLKKKKERKEILCCLSISTQKKIKYCIENLELLYASSNL